TANGVLCGLVEKAPPVDCAVHVRVEENEQFLIKIVCGLAFHYRGPPRAIRNHTSLKTARAPSKNDRNDLLAACTVVDCRKRPQARKFAEQMGLLLIQSHGIS